MTQVGGRFPVGLLLHASFLLVAGAAVGRLIAVDSPLCPLVITLSSVLAVGYVVGLVRWERLGRWRPVWLGALVLLWLALMVVVPAPFTTSFGWLAIPLAVLAMRLGNVGVGVGVGVVFSVVLGVRLMSEPGFPTDLVVAPIVAVWATVGLYAAQQSESVRRKRLINLLSSTRDELALRQRQAGVLAERARIAGEIHDTLAQELAGSRMLLQAAERDWTSSPGSAREKVRAATDALGANLLQARRMIADLTPVELDEGDLTIALEAICERERRYGGAAVEFQVSGASRQLPQQNAAALLRAVQGALANVRDHAGASQVWIELCWRDDQVMVTVRDNGVGFDPAQHTAEPGRGFGLTALRARLALSLGVLEVRSTPGGGTVLSASVPVLAERSLLVTIRT